MKQKLLEKFKEKLEKNVLGVFSKTTDSSIVEIFGLSGFDFIILDNEHGYTNYETLKHHIRAAELSNLTPIIRVPNDNTEAISKSLDIGAYGVQVPNINSKEQVERVINSAKFYPQGERGVCKYVRAAEFTNLDKNKYFEHANDTLILIQVEGKEGLNNIDEILDVKGIDVLFIGPYDLSQALGFPGDIMHTKVIETIHSIIDKAKNKNVKIGVFCDDIDAALIWKKIGVNFIACSVDYGLLLEHNKKNIRKWNQKDYE